MRVLVLHHPTNRIKGEIRTHGVEVDTNVFVFDMTTKDVDSLWSWLWQQSLNHKNFTATLIEPCSGKPGFSTRSFGSNQGKTSVIDGVLVKSRPIT